MGIIAGYVGHKLGRLVAGKTAKLLGMRNRSHIRMLGGFAGALNSNALPIIGSFKKGGKVKKTGAYILHKGETVVPVRKARYRKHK